MFEYIQILPVVELDNGNNEFEAVEMTRVTHTPERRICENSFNAFTANQHVAFMPGPIAVEGDADVDENSNLHTDFSVPGFRHPELCEHGMAQWLCMGPGHYPTDEQEMRGEYF